MCDLEIIIMVLPFDPGNLECRYSCSKFTQEQRSIKLT